MGKPVHIHRFDGGHRTPAEYYREHMFSRQQCSFGCAEPVALKARVLADAAEFARREPESYLALAVKAGGADPAFPSTYGPLVLVETLYACDRCKDSLRHSCAGRVRAGYMFAEFDETGLESSHPVAVQVPGASGE